MANILAVKASQHTASRHYCEFKWSICMYVSQNGTLFRTTISITGGKFNMKKIMIVFALMLSVLFIAPHLQADAATQKLYNNWLYYKVVSTKTGKVVHITGHKGEPALTGEWVIPSRISGYPVTEIADHALNMKGNYSPEWHDSVHVKLPNTVKRIGNYAFANNRIEVINMPASLQIIGEYAFANNFFYHIEIPNTVKSVASTAFTDNPVESYNIPSKLLTPKKQAGDLYYTTFSRNGKKEVRITGYNIKTTKTSLVVPDKIAGLPVTEVNHYAFSTYESVLGAEHQLLKDGTLKRVELPNSVRFIGNYAFKGQHLESITLPKSLTKIGDYAFQGNALNELRIPISVTSAGKAAFADNKLTNVIIGSGLKNISEGLFKNNQIATLELRSGVKTIGKAAFMNNALPLLYLHDSVTTIGTDAFAFNKIGHLRLPAKLETIPKAFRNNQIKIIEFPQNVRRIESVAFENNSLEQLILPNSVKIIGPRAFEGNAIHDLTLSNQLTTLGSGAFANNALTEIQLPATLTTIPEGAFAQNDLTEVIIPNTVTTIERHAFMENDIAALTIPGTVKSFALNAIQANPLTVIQFEGGATKVIAEGFDLGNIGVYKDKQLTVLWQGHNKLITSPTTLYIQWQ